MNDILQFLSGHIVLVIPLVIFLVLGNFAFRHLRNLRKGVYLDFPSGGDVLWSERFASGRSYRSLGTRMGGASNCLHIAITGDALYVQPIFPFVILGTDLDLIHKVPLRRITLVDPGSGRAGRCVDIGFLDSEGCPRKICLAPNNREGFLACLDAARRG